MAVSMARRCERGYVVQVRLMCAPVVAPKPAAFRLPFELTVQQAESSDCGLEHGR